MALCADALWRSIVQLAARSYLQGSCSCRTVKGVPLADAQRRPPARAPAAWPVAPSPSLARRLGAGCAHAGRHPGPLQDNGCFTQCPASPACLTLLCMPRPARPRLQSSNFGMGGWWLGGSHMKPNTAFMSDVQVRVGAAPLAAGPALRALRPCGAPRARWCKPVAGPALRFPQTYARQAPAPACTLAGARALCPKRPSHLAHAPSRLAEGGHACCTPQRPSTNRFPRLT